MGSHASQLGGLQLLEAWGVAINDLFLVPTVLFISLSLTADVQRALSILERIVTEAADDDGARDLEEDELEYECLLPVQAMADVLASPLFTALVGIQQQMEQVGTRACFVI